LSSHPAGDQNNVETPLHPIMHTFQIGQTPINTKEKGMPNFDMQKLLMMNI
jgi:hypothetical protein